MENNLTGVAIGLIDLTNLDDSCAFSDVADLCNHAISAGVPAVCVYPEYVGFASTALKESGVEVATVINFPQATERPYSVGLLTHDAVCNGATEIDVVLPYDRYSSGDLVWCSAILRTVVANAHGRTVKVIIESGALESKSQERGFDKTVLVKNAAKFSLEHGADFVKTSTGKTAVGCTAESARALFEIAATHGGGVKLSGGIRTPEQAFNYIELATSILGDDWVNSKNFRIGASSLLDALEGNV